MNQHKFVPYGDLTSCVVCGQLRCAPIHEIDDVDPELVHEIEDSNDEEISEDGM
jgi:hypothetical protein